MLELRGVTPVLIVGGGPCGLTLSIELGRRGVDSVVIDSKLHTALNPQANATQARTMEHYRRLGFAHEIRALGLPKDYPTDIAYFTRYLDKELARFELPSSQDAQALSRGVTALGAHKVGVWNSPELPHRVSQKFVETVLRRHAEACETSSINYGWRLVSFEERPNTLIAEVEHVETGQVQTVETQYLVAADGARSTVRRQLGIEYGGETGVSRDFFGGRMVAIYFRAPDFYRLMPHRRAWMYWAFNPERRSWLAAVDGISEFAFHTQLKGDESEEITDTRARELLFQAMGGPIEAELLDVSTWIAGHTLVAESFGTDRIFIAGDAAHLFTPAGGLGYNTAVDDAVNLGWKLAAAIKGCAGSRLLSSYAAERRQLAVRNTGYARELARSIGDYVPHPRIEAQGAEGDAARRAAGEYLNGHARREFNIPGITFGARYDASDVVMTDGAVLPLDAANVYVPTASPGGRMPHLWLEDGTSIFDMLGFEWTLMMLSDDAATRQSFEAAAAHYSADLKIVALGSPEARELYESDLVLIRPDQVVAWRGSLGEIDPARIFATVLGYEQAEVCRVAEATQ